MKKHCVAFLIFIILPTVLFASSDTTYLNGQLKKTSTSKAIYKRVSQSSPNFSGYEIIDYTMSNTLYMKAESITPNGSILNGQCIFYHKNGNKQSEGNYKSNNQYGTWYYWSEDHKDTITAEFGFNGKQTIIRNTITIRMDSIEKARRPSTNDSTLKPNKNSVEVDAEFPGGMQAFTRFLSSNIQYPEEAQARSVSGKTIIYFEIDKEGIVCNIMPRTSVGFGLEEEAMRVLKAMPKWKPATQDGRAVRVRRTVPVAFTLPPR